MIFRFKTTGCPDADGRVPLADELKWTLKFPLAADGSTLFIELGAKDMAALKEMLGWEERDDLIELRAELARLKAQTTRQ